MTSVSTTDSRHLAKPNQVNVVVGGNGNFCNRRGHRPMPNITLQMFIAWFAAVIEVLEYGMSQICLRDYQTDSCMVRYIESSLIIILRHPPDLSDTLGPKYLTTNMLTRTE